MDKRLFETEKRTMTEKDRLAVGAELARINLAILVVRDESSAVARVYRGKLQELEDQRNALSTQLDEGAVEIRFEVIEVPDDARMMIQILRKDTEQPLSTRPMNEAEREAARKRKQGDLFDGDEDLPRPPALPKSKKNNGKAAKERRAP